MQFNKTPGFKEDTNSSAKDASVKENASESKMETSENPDGFDEELSLEFKMLNHSLYDQI